MLPTAPSFLFLFLPAVMAIYALIPAAYRRYAILLFNLTYYIIAVWRQPSDLLLLLLTSAFTYSAGFLIAVTHRRSTLLGAIAVDLFAFLIFRLSYDYSDPNAYFHFGAVIYLIASISYLIDIYRNDAPHAKNIGELLTYMIFFPTMIVGPIIRYKDFLKLLDNIDFSLENCAEGIRLYIFGFLERIAIAAVLGYMLDQIAEVPEAATSIPLVLLTALLYTALAFFALAGYSTMARGLMYMLGIRHAPDFAFTPTASTVSFPRRFYISLNRWVDDYLVYPILRLQQLPAHFRRILSVCITCLIPPLWIKTEWYLLIPLLPVLIWRIAHILRESGRRHDLGRWQLLLGRIGYTVVFALTFIGFWYAASLPDAAAGLAQLRALTERASFVVPYATYPVLAYVNYLAVGLLGLVCFIPLQPALESRIALLPRPVGITIRAAALIGVMSSFAFTLFHFLPQFPQYATRAFAHLVF